MTIESAQQRTRAVSVIRDIVSALRAIAAGRIQGAQRSLTGARRYQEVVERGLALLPEAPWPPTDGRATLLLVLMSEQPLCGSFNQDVLELAARRWRELKDQGEARLLVVGQRGRRLLAARGLPVDATLSGATSLAGLRELVKGLAERVGPAYAAREVGSVQVVYSHYRSVSEQVPTVESLLPPERPEPRHVPIRFHRYLPLPELTAGLIGEYAFIHLYRLAAESFASEQAARLLAMDAATRNTERLLQSLLDLERRERQGEITRQVLELVAAHFTSDEWGSQEDA